MSRWWPLIGPRRGRKGASSEPGERESPPGPADPAVVLDVELADGTLWLVLANDSDWPAFRVAVRFDGPLPGVGGEIDVTKSAVFRDLALLRPGREVRVFVDPAVRFFARGGPDCLCARVSWESARRERFTQVFRHHLSVWRDLGQIG